MGKRLSFPMAVVTAIVASMFLTNSTCAGAAPPTLISDAGKNLSSVFEGLKANPALRPDQLAKYRPLRQPWRGMISGRLPGVSRVHFTEGDNCPTSPCTGNYTAFYPQPGGCGQVGCPEPNDFHTDVSGAACNSGEMDNPCFDGITCCTNAEYCPSSTGCPR